jgi:hypothetical protein
VPIVLGHGDIVLADPSVDRVELWTMRHEARTDLSMLLWRIQHRDAASRTWDAPAHGPHRPSFARITRRPHGGGVAEAGIRPSAIAASAETGICRPRASSHPQAD